MQEHATAGFWLSPQQKLAWKLQQQTLPGSSRATCLISLTGQLDANEMHGALQEIVSRHEILRTVFRRQTGMKFPFQVVLEKGEVGWEEVDFSGLATSERGSQLQKLWDAERDRENSLEEQPALRAVLVKFAQESFSLILSFSCLCVDSKSLHLLSRELGVIYSGEQNGLQEPFRYVQFAQWQADLLGSDEEDSRQGRDFWTRQQAASLVAPALPREYMPNLSSFRPELLTIKIEQGSAILRRSDSSDLLLAAWVCLLNRLSGRNAFLIGYFADGREYEELENAIGCFVRTLPVPARVENTFRFTDVLRHTAEAV